MKRLLLLSILCTAAVVINASETAAKAASEVTGFTFNDEKLSGWGENNAMSGRRDDTSHDAMAMVLFMSGRALKLESIFFSPGNLKNIKKIRMEMEGEREDCEKIDSSLVLSLSNKRGLSYTQTILSGVQVFLKSKGTVELDRTIVIAPVVELTGKKIKINNAFFQNTETLLLINPGGLQNSNYKAIKIDFEPSNVPFLVSGEVDFETSKISSSVASLNPGLVVLGATKIIIEFTDSARAIINK